MKTYEATYKNNSDYGTFDWKSIMKDAAAYKYVVMYRDHYRGNGRGEYFNSEEFEKIFAEQDFWFYNCERPVWKVILTNDEVPAIIGRRRLLVREINLLSYEIQHIYVPFRPACDGRATRRTQPEAFAEWDKAKAKAERKIKKLRTKRDNIRKQLEAVQPYYSTTLYKIT